MYELKKIGKIFTSKFVGTGPSSYKKKTLPGRGLTKVKKHWYRLSFISLDCEKLQKNCAKIFWLRFKHNTPRT